MKWLRPHAVAERTEDPRDAELRAGLDGLKTLTQMLNSAVDEVMEGDLGARERRG